MLTGHFAFIAHSQEELLQRIALGKYEMLQPYFKDLDETSKSIIYKLLRKDPTTRFTAAEALEHEFFTQSTKKEKKSKASKNDNKKKDDDVLAGMNIAGAQDDDSEVSAGSASDTDDADDEESTSEEE